MPGRNPSGAVGPSIHLQSSAGTQCSCKKLKKINPKQVAAGKGRAGMDLWKILVLGTLRLNCNWDFDKLHNIANEHKTAWNF
jgi:hypothetical protein